MKLRRTLSLLISLCIATTLMAGCKKDEPKRTDSTQPNQNTQAASEGFDIGKAGNLNVKVFGKIPSGAEKPQEDKLTPIWREKTKVIPEVVQLPQGMDHKQWFQMQMVAGTMPQIISEANNNNYYNFLVDSKVFREIKYEDIKRYMPRTFAKLNGLGIDPDEYFNAHKDPRDGKLWKMPSWFDYSVTNITGEDWALHGGNCNYLAFRDDILKKIFPQSKTVEELKHIYKKKGGKLDWEDINDIPIKNNNDLYEYLKKVKALGLKAGGRDVTPGQLQWGNDAGALMWSMWSMVPYIWQNGDRLQSEKGIVYFTDLPQWKEHIKWFNKYYNEGLLDRETFIQKDDQRDAKVINGVYAVYNESINSHRQAVQKAEKDKAGYGYRKVGMFLPLSYKTQYQEDLLIGKLANETRSWAISTTVKESEVPQLLNWFDWNFSDEAEILRMWGPKEFYTGEGKNMRFKPEYKGVEEWARFGKKVAAGSKDGNYYGLYKMGDTANTNYETYAVYMRGHDRYLPGNIYPKDTDTVSNENVNDAIGKATQRFNLSNRTAFKEKTLPKEVLDLKATYSALDKEFNDLKKVVTFDAPDGKTATIKCIVEKPENFEKNYSDFEKKFITPELRENLKKQSETWVEYWKLYSNYLEPIKK